MKINRNNLAPPRIEMMPLIDIVFLLLVFFIYAMLSMTVYHGQHLDLPSSSSAALETKDAITISIQVSEQGMRLLVNDEPVPISSLNQILSGLNTGNAKNVKGCEVQLFADKKLPYQSLFQVLDLIKQSGISRISLQATARHPAQ